MSLADPVSTDADLVAGVLAGDQASFAAVYDRYADRLYDFAQSMLRERQDAADAVADAFVTAAEKLSQLRDPSLLRPWLYSVTRRECLRRLEQRKRVAYDAEDRLVVMPDENLGPAELAEAEALRRLVWDAAAGLNDRDRAVLDLHLRQGLDGAELAEALDVKPSHAYTMMNRLRGQLERSIGALTIARLGRDECEELDRVLADWDGRFSPLVRKRVSRHVDDCEVCERRRAVLANPFAAAFAAIAPLAAPAGLRERVLDSVQLVAHRPRRWWRRHLVAIVIAGVVLGTLVATAWLWPGEGEPGSAPTTGAPTTTTPTGPTTEPSASPRPAVLQVDRTSVDLSAARAAVVTLTNTGEQDLTFDATPSRAWVTLSAGSGTLAPGTSAQLTVSRGSLPEGRSAASIAISSNGGDAQVSVTAALADPPVVGRVTITSDSCSGGRLLQVAVTVRDESPVRSVRLVWSGPGNGSTELSRSGSRTWRGTVGPFPAVDHPLAMRVTAVDALGQSASRTTTMNIDPCPG